MAVRNDEEVVRAPEVARYPLGVDFAMGNDRRSQTAKMEPELMIDFLMSPVMWIDVVGGPHDLVAELASQLQRSDQIHHLTMHDLGVVVIVLVLGPLKVENIDEPLVPA
jgi:hypothetical protein